MQCPEQFYASLKLCMCHLSCMSCSGCQYAPRYNSRCWLSLLKYYVTWTFRRTTSPLLHPPSLSGHEDRICYGSHQLGTYNWWDHEKGLLSGGHLSMVYLCCWGMAGSLSCCFSKRQWVLEPQMKLKLSGTRNWNQDRVQNATSLFYATYT